MEKEFTEVYCGGGKGKTTLEMCIRDSSTGESFSCANSSLMSTDSTSPIRIFVSGGTATPVSYTHLDVYKRQQDNTWTAFHCRDLRYSYGRTPSGKYSASVSRVCSECCVYFTADDTGLS